MNKFNFIIFPYRGMSFYSDFGLAVRDLQIMAALVNSSLVEKIKIIERPLTIYENILGKNRINDNLGVFSSSKVEVIRCLSWDFFGPLSGRSWTEKCYNKNYNLDSILENNYMDGFVNIILDFTPIAKLVISNNKWIYWYDLIDNFTKHNRFSISQRDLVRKKYININKEENFISGVSEGAISSFRNATVVRNCVGINRGNLVLSKNITQEFDFGFIGFITDKFDIELIRVISKLGYKTVIYGEVYDKNIGRSLKKISNVKLKGKFHSKEIPILLGTFKVGMIPYIKEKMHDESPLKLYQYLNFGMPVITSKTYDIKDEYIFEYDLNNLHELKRYFTKLTSVYNDEQIKKHLQSLISKENFWDYKIERLLDHLARDSSSLRSNI